MVTRDEFAKLVIGRPGRIRLAAWLIGRSDPFFYQHQAVLGTGDVISEVQHCLEHFIKLGLIEKSRRDRQQYYRRLDTPVWNVFQATLDALAALERKEAKPFIQRSRKDRGQRSQGRVETLPQGRYQ